MNEPQLSAEMEKRFDKEFQHDFRDGGTSSCYGGNDCDCWVKDVKHFLATALEEEREKLLSEVEKMKKTDKFPQSLTTYDGKTKYFDRLSDGDLHYNQAISDVLNQLKGNHE